jgi:hypothetical protein
MRSTKIARTEANETVEIKLTGGDSVAISSDSNTPLLLIVLKLDPITGFEEIYNGQFPLDLWRSKTPNKRGVVTLRRHKEPFAPLPTAVRPNLPVEHRVFIKQKSKLTPLPILRYSSRP